MCGMSNVLFHLYWPQNFCTIPVFCTHLNSHNSQKSLQQVFFWISILASPVIGIHGRVPWMFVDCDVQIISVSSLCVLMLLMLLMLLYLLFASHQSRNQLHCNPGHCPKQSQHAECIPLTLATLPSVHSHSPHNTGDPTFFPLSTCHTMPL